MRKEILMLNYHVIIEQYLSKFCKKQKLEFDFWIGIHQLATFTEEYTINMSDIIYDIDNSCPKGLILQWINDNLDNTQQINYHSYFLGLRHDHLKDQKHVV